MQRQHLAYSKKHRLQGSQSACDANTMFELFPKSNASGVEIRQEDSRMSVVVVVSNVPSECMLAKSEFIVVHSFSSSAASP